MPTKISWRRREEAGGAMMQPGCMRRLLGDGREGEDLGERGARASDRDPKLSHFLVERDETRADWASQEGAWALIRCWGEKRPEWAWHRSAGKATAREKESRSRWRARGWLRRATRFEGIVATWG